MEDALKWLANLISGIALALAAWVMKRSADHGERLRVLEDRGLTSEMVRAVVLAVHVEREDLFAARLELAITKAISACRADRREEREAEVRKIVYDMLAERGASVRRARGGDQD